MKDVLYLEELTYEDVHKLDRNKAFVLLPMGPVEAHGPHLPLGVDIRAAVVTAELAAHKVAARGFQPVLAPVMPYTLADVAMPFAGTITLSAETVFSFTLDLAKSLACHRFKHLVIFCHHGERQNFYTLCDAAERAKKFGIQVLVSRTLIDGMSKLDGLLKGEFPQLDFHAGEFETSLYLWKYPHLVKKEIARNLPPNWSNIREKWKQGAKNFIEAGGPSCYFGAPALASAETGQKVYEAFSSQLAEEILQFLTQSKE